MSNRQQEQWGGEVTMPRWLRRVLRRREPLGPTPEAVHEARKPQDGPSAGQNVDRAVAGPMTELYHEGRAARQAKRRAR
jgi:hypothetical protein